MPCWCNWRRKAVSPERMRVRLCDWQGAGEIALALRTQVFVVEQGVPKELEEDGLDPNCTHFLAEIPDGEGWRPVGTARLRRKGQAGKAERVAVLAELRGQGIGALLMAALEDEARAQGMGEVILHAQVAVVPFYERIGYRGEGPVFSEAGIDHRAMRRRIQTT